MLKFFSPYQALHLFSTRVLSEIFLTPCSIHSIVRTQCVVISSSIFSSYQVIIQFFFLFNRSAARSCSSLFLFSNGVFPTSFISIVFFSQNGLTFAWFFGFTHWSKKQLSFTSSLPLPFLSGAILDLGTRSSCSGGVL